MAAILRLHRRRANDCVRGMQAMDRVATESGAQRASEAYWEVMVDDIKLGIMADSASWQNIQDQRPDLTLVSLREVALAYRHYSDTHWTRWSRPRSTSLALK